MMKTYLEHLFTINHNSQFRIEERINQLAAAEQAVLKDYKYRYTKVPAHSLLELLRINEAWLAVFLYRFGRVCFLENEKDELLREIHRLLRVHCGMEIYFSVPIGEGFEVRHGLGSVIGSRCSIGKGFVIHHGCTLGHRIQFGNGPTLLDDVEMGVNSSVLGEITVGNKVKIGAHTLVLHDVPNGQVVKGNF